MAFNKRVLKEIQVGYASPDFDFFQDTEGVYDDAGICYLRFTIAQGIYAGETHVLQIKFIYGGLGDRKTYPRDAPNVLFMTPIFHTNIATGGSICLDVIKSDKWSPLYGINAIFTSIIVLLDVPNTNSPFNVDASRAYSEHKKKKDLAGYSQACHDYYERGIADKNTLAYRLLHAKEFEKVT